MPLKPALRSDFAACHETWLRANAEAGAAECELGRALDRYCEGCGQAPPLPQFQEAQRLRLEAGRAWAALLAAIDVERRRRPLI